MYYESKPFKEYLDCVIAIGEGIVQSSSNVVFDSSELGQFIAGCNHIGDLLGPRAGIWQNVLKIPIILDMGKLKRNVGQLIALRDVILRGLLVNVESLIRADAFEDLLQQADHLYEENYSLAAAVLGRAVLEEHLRKLSSRSGVVISRNNPTINDFNQALYQGTHFDKTTMKHVESMATIGNDAAHNKSVEDADVGRLLRDVRGFLAQHPIV